MRIVDPAAAMWNKARSVSPSCQHSPDKTKETDTKIMAAWGFDELLGEWDPADWDDTKPWVTKIFDSYLKQNVALSLAASGISVKGEECCLDCAIEALSIFTKGSSGLLGSTKCVIGFEPHSGIVARKQR